MGLKAKTTAIHEPQRTALLGRIAGIIGDKYVLTDPTDMAPYLKEPRDLFHGTAQCIARPGTTAEVAALVALCAETGTKIVPQGGNTGLVGGQIPFKDDEIVLSLARLNRLREVDPVSNTLTVEAGMTLTQVQAEAERVDRYFPLSLASEGSCTIGGNLSTNAGGTAAVAYGTARDMAMGLEVVLADGRIMSDLSKLKKDNTGYNLTQLFVGSEGTLGIITAAVLKLYPRPLSFETAFVGLADPHQALRLLNLAHKRTCGDVNTFELMPRIGIEFVLAHGTGVRDPLPASHRYYVLLELTSQAEDLGERMVSLLEAAIEDAIIEDAAVAASLDQRRAFWRLRELMSEVQSYEGGSIKHDVSVPISEVPVFLDEVEKAVTARIPGARLVAFGHLGDGNIHSNVSQPIGADKAAFLARWDEVNGIVHDIVHAHNGSISAEHGIGRLKRTLLPKVKDPVALDVMRSLKATLDPQGILNPGKLL